MKITGNVTSLNYLYGVIIFLVSLFVAGCTPKTEKQVYYQTENLEIVPLSDHTWRHVSYLTLDNGNKVPCNGLIYTNAGETIIMDTPVTDVASAELIAWTKDKTGQNPKAVVVTHFHIDCLGGLKTFHDLDIPSYASEITEKLAREDQAEVPRHIFPISDFAEVSGNYPALSLKAGNQEVVTTFFGAGHAPGNSVCYVPAEKTLFGGCLVKSMNAGRGNLADADTLAWPQTIQKILASYPELKTVVPGHGQPGGTELLQYTRKMFTP